MNLGMENETLEYKKNLDNTPLKNNWSKVKDIIIAFAFSLVNDKKDILNIYNFKF